MLLAAVTVRLVWRRNGLVTPGGGTVVSAGRPSLMYGCSKASSDPSSVRMAYKSSGLGYTLVGFFILSNLGGS